MKKSIAIILILGLIAPFAGTYLYLQFEKSKVRKEVKKRMISGLKEGELVTLSFSTQEAEAKLDWEHSKEFEYNGQMYDVVESKITADSAVYVCWPDDDETLLNKQLKGIVAVALGHHQKSKESRKNLISFFKSVYCQDIEIQRIAPMARATGLLCEYFTFEPLWLKSPPSPPPEYC